MSVSSPPVLVIGGGIAGVQATLDLAEAGARVVLVEKTHSLGGVMAALDKNFPTLDCSICIEAPKLSEVAENGNVEILTDAEVVGLEKKGEGYVVTIRQKGNLVSNECTRCDLCAQACPVVLPNAFDQGMASRKAIYTPFPQAVPGPYFLDAEKCVNEYPILLTCTRCYDVCGPKAINFDRPLDVQLRREVSSVIVSAGFETVDPAALPEYGYGTHPDILTSLELERLLSSAGPSGGEIVCPSDGRHAKRIVFVLCAGSRDIRNIPQCSRFCCMYSIKEAVQVRDHGVEDVTITYIDIRSYGKGFDAFYQRAKDQGVRFLRGRPSRVRYDGKELKVRVADTATGEVKEVGTDLVVLAMGASPPRALSDLAKVLSLKTGVDGFMTEEGAPAGIYVAGSAAGPKDIPDSVIEGGAAAAKSLERVKYRFWAKPEVGEPLPVDGEARVGVFLCDCGSNIAGTVNVPQVTRYAGNLPNVVHAEEVRFACAANTQADMAKKIVDLKLNRLVVPACSPKTHEATFKRVCMRAGLNPYLLEMANVRNMDSWVHKNEPDRATGKAQDLVRMAVEKAVRLRPLVPLEQHVVRAALVVGGGPAGMAAASNLARQGYEVHLVEKSDRLGGALRFMSYVDPYGLEAPPLLDAMVREVENSGVRLHLSSQVAQVDGHVGEFRAHLSTGEVVDTGAIILATGGRTSTRAATEGPLVSTQNPLTITNERLHEMIREGNVPGDRVTLVSCVGSRNGRLECSRYCCGAMVGQALRLRRMGKKVRVLYRDMRTFARGAEDLYREAAEAGVAFFRYPDATPESTLRLKDGSVIFRDELLGRDVELPTDLLVLMSAIEPADEDVSKMLKVTKDSAGFLLERHPKLGPVEVASAGIYVCGSAQAPKDVRESIAQGLAAATKASGLLAHENVEKEPLVAQINLEKCNGCGRCVPVCPYQAIEPIVVDGKKKVQVVGAACLGCGTCGADCYRDAITNPGFTDEQILAQVDAALADDPEHKVLVFACNWCSYAGADQAGIEKIQYPAVPRTIRTMCSGRVSEDFVKRAFEKGAGAVLLTGCHPGDCHYINANTWTEKRFRTWSKMLERKGIAPERFQLEWISAAEGKEFARKIREMAEVIHRYGATRERGKSLPATEAVAVK
jgi:heterodisulfide reductase subunit A2